MSTLYLPNGGRIVIHCGWKSTTDTNSGHVTLRKHDDTFIGAIHTNGTVHLTADCSHTYYPPGTTLDNAVEVVERDIRKIGYYKLRQLKELLSNYNAKTCCWKNH